MKLKIFAAALTTFLILFFAYQAYQPRQSTTVTIGVLANKDNDFSRHHLQIKNAGMGKKTGRFLVFRSLGPDTYPIVFALASDAMIPFECSVFTGYCAGIRVSEIAGCPCETPFVLVTDVSPASSSKID